MKDFLMCLVLLTVPNIGVSQIWDNIIQDIDTTGTIYLTDSSWSNTLIKNCTIHNTGIGNDGIFLRNVSNVRIENCTIYNIDGQGGIRMSISGGGTDSIQIVNSLIFNVQENGINAPQRSQNSPPLDQSNLQIIGNTIYNTGLADESGLHHSIYCQASDFLIKDNIIFGIRDGNGISVRSSGTLSGNIISGESKANKPAIRYFSDHFTGSSDTLLIENNIVFNDSSDAHVIELYEHADLYQSSVNDLHVVKNFNIRFNTAVSFQPNMLALRISDDYNSNGYWLSVAGNIFSNITSVTNCLSVPDNTHQISNFLSGDLSNYQNSIQPYNFHITSNHGAINFVGATISDFPLTDIDGEPRMFGSLDAGADEFYATTALTSVLKQSERVKVYPNPITNGQLIEVETEEPLKSLIILNSIGQYIYHIDYKGNSKQATLDTSEKLIKSGVYYILINNQAAVPVIIK